MKKLIACFLFLTAIIGIADAQASLTCVFVLQRWSGHTGGGSGGPLIRTARIVLPSLPVGRIDRAWTERVVLETSLKDGLDAGEDPDGMPLRYPYRAANLRCHHEVGTGPDARILCLDASAEATDPNIHFWASISRDFRRATLSETSVLAAKAAFSIDGSCK